MEGAERVSRLTVGVDFSVRLVTGAALLPTVYWTLNELVTDETIKLGNVRAGDGRVVDSPPAVAEKGVDRLATME